MTIHDLEGPRAARARATGEGASAGCPDADTGQWCADVDTGTRGADVDVSNRSTEVGSGTGRTARAAQGATDASESTASPAALSRSTASPAALSRSTASPDNRPWASVTACPNGPLLVRGDVQILLASGEPAPRRRATVALCRCGASGIKPYCDGSHKAIDFRTDDEPV